MHYCMLYCMLLVLSLLAEVALLLHVLQLPEDADIRCESLLLQLLGLAARLGSQGCLHLAHVFSLCNVWNVWNVCWCWCWCWC